MPSTRSKGGSARDPRIDAYIAGRAPFAQPILAHLRELVHRACPDVVETVKWGHPCFEHHGMLCNMAAFKAHAAFGFWKHELLVEDDAKAGEAMGSFGRLERIEDLPSDRELMRLVKLAAKLNEGGVKVERKRAARAPFSEPEELARALRGDKRAKAVWDGFPPSCRREYIDWIVEAKRDETRAKRLEETLSNLAEGKRLRWRYER